MAQVRGKRRCFSCRKFRWVARSGTRPNGSTWFLCRTCADAWNRVRKYEREAIETLRIRGDL